MKKMPQPPNLSQPKVMNSDIAPIAINYLYGEVLLPFGLFRVGRQPISDVGTISLNDGRSGRNLWGESYYHESVDRLVFGTKIATLSRTLVDRERGIRINLLETQEVLAGKYDETVAQIDAMRVAKK